MTIAEELSTLFQTLFRAELPVRLRAWDGSQTGPGDAPILHIRDKNALRRMVWRPGELGLAQAYITGEIEVIGDLRDGLMRMWRVAGGSKRRPGPAMVLRSLPFALRHRILGPPPAVPQSQAKPRGRLHSRARDREVISHHYDLSNEFYAKLLDDDLVYSCAYWRDDEPGYDLASAQRDKLDLICRKLRLREGMRLLDVGCGWGALGIYAASHYGVNVVGVTLSKRQHAFATERVREEGLSDRVDFRLCDYRDLPDSGFDAVATIEMGEHVGDAQYPAFAKTLQSRLRRGGRLLVQQMSRESTAPGGGAFIESYIAPDMHMRPLGRTVVMLQEAGLEIRDVEAIREHYVRTVSRWHETLESRWEEFVDAYGEMTARIWRLYLVGGALAFEQGRMGVDQILAVAGTANSSSRLPATREWSAATEEV